MKEWQLQLQQPPQLQVNLRVEAGSDTSNYNLSVTIQTRGRYTKTLTCTVLLSPFCSHGENIDVRPIPKPVLKEVMLTK